MRIEKLFAREILDSRGVPTVEATVVGSDGVSATASVPSGTSTGAHEAFELRDGDAKRYRGRGVLRACENIEGPLASAVRGLDPADFKSVESAIRSTDGTKHKTRMGANATLGVSLACARLGALSRGEPLWKYLRRASGIRLNAFNLPLPFMNIFNGGRHADTNLDFQEFMIVPLKGKKFSDRVEVGVEVFWHLSEVLHEFGYDTDVGLEGGYAPDLSSSIQALEMLVLAVRRAKLTAGKDIAFAIDVGASELYDKRRGGFVFKLDHAFIPSDHMLSLFEHWVDRFPIMAIEDPFGEDDIPMWSKGMRALGKKDLLLVGDDLFVTNPERFKMLAPKKVANAAIVKPNQIGTLSETFAFVAAARAQRMKLIASHRSGETCDDWISDLAVAIGAHAIKGGSVSRGERVAKWNRLMAIEEEIKKK
ncbi:MAG: phosphopyruvate hydratase [bacterium]|nr:phosphopyruvate hydratase [bacterium]